MIHCDHVHAVIPGASFTVELQWLHNLWNHYSGKHNTIGELSVLSCVLYPIQIICSSVHDAAPVWKHIEQKPLVMSLKVIAP